MTRRPPRPKHEWSFYAAPPVLHFDREHTLELWSRTHATTLRAARLYAAERDLAAVVTRLNSALLAEVPDELNVRGELTDAEWEIDAMVEHATGVSRKLRAIVWIETFSFHFAVDVWDGGGPSDSISPKQREALRRWNVTQFWVRFLRHFPDYANKVTDANGRVSDKLHEATTFYFKTIFARIGRTGRASTTGPDAEFSSRWDGLLKLLRVIELATKSQTIDKLRAEVTRAANALGQRAAPRSGRAAKA